VAQKNWFRYTRDDGTTHVSVKTLAYIAATTDFGFGAASGADPLPPYGFKPRVIYLAHTATNRNRKEVVSTPAAYTALMAGNQTVDLPEEGSATLTTWRVTNGRGEHFSRGGIPGNIHP
jgi:hypothetical protein